MTEIFDTLWGFVLLHPILPIVYFVGVENIPENYTGTFIILLIMTFGFSLYGYACLKLNKYLPKRDTNSFWGKLYYIFTMYLFVCSGYIFLGMILGFVLFIMICVYVFSLMF
tara:strand:- start:128 stop:463 length:336 start_codon:yes stop_codon:yes gene_type:complete